jgi:hypothetical protein
MSSELFAFQLGLVGSNVAIILGISLTSNEVDSEKRQSMYSEHTMKLLQ